MISRADRSKKFGHPVYQLLACHKFLPLSGHVLDFDLWPFISEQDRNARLCVPAKIGRDRRSKLDVFEDAADFPGGFDRRGKLLIELGCIPIHLRQR